MGKTNSLHSNYTTYKGKFEPIGTLSNSDDIEHIRHLPGFGKKTHKKEFFSDENAEDNDFVPNHEEFYIGGTDYLDDLEPTRGRDEDLRGIYDKTDEIGGDIDVTYSDGVANIAIKTTEDIVDTMSRKEKRAYWGSAFSPQKKKRPLDEGELIVGLDGESAIEDIYKNRKTMRKNHVSMSPSQNDDSGNKYFRKEENMRGKNSKKITISRSLGGGVAELENEAYNDSIKEDMWTEAGEAKSQLEEILSTTPHIIWSRKDEKKLNREKNKKAA